ncbi:hypothetical protein HAX54_002532 [Datura stramonium]|uniref:Uncharacterized protein n=1 Tax=Datura stramonium TaxID=4076 RepID=A0ABS8T5K2_DATST|nr:hypothetical protein [Datura stramonium]
MKRRIADVFEPGETVEVLRRLKGTSNNKKGKMSVETKQLFDQLTEDAMKLMENGDFNVYEEKQESFQREAEGYEKLAQKQGKLVNRCSLSPIISSMKVSFPVGQLLLQEDILWLIQMWLHQIHLTQLARVMMHLTCLVKTMKVLQLILLLMEVISMADFVLMSPLVITTAAVWATIMIHHLDCIAMHHQDNGTL